LKNNQISNLIKICPVGVELFRVDRQTHMRQLTAGFSQLCEKPIKVKHTNRPSQKTHCVPMTNSKALFNCVLLFQRLYSVSHSLPNSAGCRTAAPCLNN